MQRKIDVNVNGLDVEQSFQLIDILQKMLEKRSDREMLISAYTAERETGRLGWMGLSLSGLNLNMDTLFHILGAGIDASITYKWSAKNVIDAKVQKRKMSVGLPTKYLEGELMVVDDTNKKMITPASQVKICQDCNHPFKEGMTWCTEVKRIFEDDHCKNCSVESFLYYQVDY